MLNFVRHIKQTLLLVLLGSVIFSLAAAPLAEAAKKWSDWGPKGQLASFTVYDSMTWCVYNHLKSPKITANDSASSYINNSDAFSGRGKGTTYPEKDTKSCGDIWKIMRDQWGISQEDSLKGMGCEYHAKGSGEQGEWKCPKDKGTRLNKFKNHIKTTLGSAPQLSDASRYLMYKNALEKHCGGKNLGEYSKLKGEDRNKVDKGHKDGSGGAEASSDTSDKRHYKKVKLVDTDGKTKEFGYSYIYKVGISDNQATLYGGGNGVKMSCEEISRHISNVAPAYQKSDKKNESVEGAGNTEGGEDEDDTSNCSVTGVGWIVCPVVIFLGEVTDGSYNMLQKLFIVDGSMFKRDGGNNQVYELWSIVRNIANALFVLAFLLIVISQITNIGLTNYSIKRMLPRILLVAIAVNLSFIVCGAMIDISNILGVSIKSYLDGVVGSNISDPAGGVWSGSNFGGWAAIGGGLLIAGGALAATAYFSIAAFVGLAITVILAIITVVIVLSVRQALIIMLVCLAPLAFCAYLFPNTESLLSKWWNVFKIMLLLFPIVAFIFGASSIASTVIMSAAEGDTLIQLVGAAVAVIPLFITPVVMKGAGGLLNKIGAVTNDKSRGPLDRLKNGAGKFDDERRQERGQRRSMRALNGTGLRGGRFNPLAKNRRRSIRRQARLANTKANSEAAETAFNINDNKAREASIDSAHASMAAGAAKAGLQSEAFGQLNTDGKLVSSKLGAAGEAEGIAAAAIAGQKDAAKADAVKNVTSTIDSQSVSELEKTLAAAINPKKDDKITAIAAEQLLSSKGEGGARALDKVIGGAASAENGMTPDMRTELSRNLPGPMMDKLETLKTWSNSTSSDGQGMSWGEAQQKATESIPKMPMQKLQSLSPGELEGALDKGAFNTPEGAVKIQQMSEPRNYSGFKENVQQAISRESANPGAKQQEVKLEQEIKQTTNDTLKIMHDTKPSGPSSSRVSAVSAEVDKATQSIDRANQALDRKVTEQKAQQKARENLGYQDRE